MKECGMFNYKEADEMKKILLLGGSTQQIVAIKTAKKMGFYTILCDYLTDNPGQYYADKFYLVSTIDREEILKVAEIEKIDGILAYASEPAAPTAAYVADKLSLPGNMLWAVETLCNKDRFRKFLAVNSLNAPRSGSYGNVDEAIADLDNFKFPVIVKPVDSSGSKGATVIYGKNAAASAILFALEYSRKRRIIIEEFIEKKHPYLIGGDIFVENGKIVLWGLMNCHRDKDVNPLVPVGKSYPLELSDEDVTAVKTTLQIMVDKLGIVVGAMNVELLIDNNDRVWPIDVGPRNGGNMIPDLLGLIFDVDVVEMSIKAAMGIKVDVVSECGVPYYATHNLHSSRNGSLKEIRFSNEIEPYVVRTYVYKKRGEHVEFFDNAGKAIGIVFLKFYEREEMLKMLSDIHEHVKVIVSEGGNRPYNT